MTKPSPISPLKCFCEIPPLLYDQVNVKLTEVNELRILACCFKEILVVCDVNLSVSLRQSVEVFKNALHCLFD